MPTPEHWDTRSSPGTSQAGTTAYPSNGIALTPDYLAERITTLSDTGAQETKRFIKLYGADYHQHVLGWFRRAQATTDSAINPASRDTVKAMRAATSIALGFNPTSAARRPFLPVFQSYRLGMTAP